MNKAPARRGEPESRASRVVWVWLAVAVIAGFSLQTWFPESRDVIDARRMAGALPHNVSGLTSCHVDMQRKKVMHCSTNKTGKDDMYNLGNLIEYTMLAYGTCLDGWKVEVVGSGFGYAYPDIRPIDC